MKNSTSVKIYQTRLALLILFLCAGIFSASAQPKEEKDASDYLYDGKAIVEKIYKARTGTAIDSYAPIDPRRQSFELTYDGQYSKALDEAITTLKKAESLAYSKGLTEVNLGNTSVAEGLRVTEREANLYLALAYLEKAQFVTNNSIDFSNVIINLQDNDIKDPYYDAANSWRKDGYLISAKLHALIAQDKIAEALKLFNAWQKFVYPNKNYFYMKTEIALPSMVQAFDLTGNYNYSRSILLETVYEQIRKDGGKFIPANNEITKQAFKAHFRNLGNAYQLAEAGTILSLQLARHAGALFLANPVLADDAKKYIMSAPVQIGKLKEQIIPNDTKIFAARVALQSSNAADNTNGWKLINDMLKNDPNNVSALAARGYANYLKGDFAAAEVDLSSAIKTNAFVAHFNDALKIRALVYRKLGKTDLAANDEKMADGFNKMFAALGAP